MHFSYCYGLIAASTILLAQAVVTSKGLYRVQAAVMLFGVTLPWVVNMIDMSRIFGDLVHRYHRDDLRDHRAGVPAGDLSATDCSS